MTVEGDDIYADPEYIRYRDKREIFQGAANSLDDELYDALTQKLISLGIEESIVLAMRYNAKYHQDAVIVTNIVSLGIAASEAKKLLEQCQAISKAALAKQIEDKGFPFAVVDSVVRYVAVVHTIAAQVINDDQEGIDNIDHHPWVREQLFQLGAAGDNCPPEYLDVVLDATCFMMLNHPEPTTDVFHVYKRYHQEGRGHIDMHAIIDELVRGGARPNQIRAIFNLHKHYGKELGSAFLALLKNASKLMTYHGGVLQLAADFADLQLEPSIQEGVINQVDKKIEYHGGALQLAVDLAAKHIPPSLQAALVKDAYYLQDYPGGLLVFAEDMHSGGFSEEAYAGLIRGLINMYAIKRDSVRHYLRGLAQLRAVNPECIEDFFMIGYHNLEPYYTMVVEDDEKLASLTADTTAAKLPHLTPKQRTHLFAKVITLSEFAAYPDYRATAFSLAARADHWTGFQFEGAIDHLCKLADGFNRFSKDHPPKGLLPSASELAGDIVTITESDQANIKGRWYYEALYYGSDRKAIMEVIQVPFGPDWNNRDYTFRPNFDAIADRFFGEDPSERAKLVTIVGIMMREAFHYHLGIGFGNEPQPMGVMCRYVFGRGPAEEGGVTVADIRQCEAILASKDTVPENFADCLATIDRVCLTFETFGDRLSQNLRAGLTSKYREATGYVVAPETPLVWAHDYLQRDPSERSSTEAALLATPLHGPRIPPDVIEALARIAARLCQKYPNQAKQFDQFLIMLLMRRPLEKVLAGGRRESHDQTLLAHVNRAGIGAHTTEMDIATLLSLVRQFEVPSIVATPEAIGDFVPPRLTRTVAAVLGTRVDNKAGRILHMLSEVGSNEMQHDDDVSLLWRSILEARTARPGFPVVGAKLHVDKQVDTALITALIEKLRLGTSGFSTIHAGMTVLLPPGQPIEIKLLLAYLKSKGLFTDRDFDMQACIAGRLKAKRNVASIGVLNASMLLATRATPSYAVDAWSTKAHNKETNAYIMAYGAGQRDRNGAYDLATPGDRTDMLGRRDLDDLDLYQIIATLVMHYEHGGYFEDIGAQFVMRVVTILQRYQLYSTLFEAPWVFEPGVTSHTATDATYQHWKMVQAFTSMRIIAEDQVNQGITGEVRAAIHEAYTQAQKRFSSIREDHPEQFVKLCTL